MITLGTPSNAAHGTSASETISIADDDPPPTLGFDATGAMVSEAAGTATATVRLSAASAFDVSAALTLGGTASTPDDYSITPTAVLIPAGQTSLVLTLSLVNDALVEGPETVTMTLGTPANGTLGAA